MCKRVFICCFILCCGITNSFAQSNGFEYTDTSLVDNNAAEQPGDNHIYEETDTNLYSHIIVIPRDTIVSWKEDKKFAYVKNLDSLLKESQRQKDETYRSTSKANSPSFFQLLLSSSVIQLFFWVLAGAIVLFILYKLFFNRGIFKRISTTLPVKEIPEEQLIGNVSDFNALIQQSYKLADYRMAIRYLFLKTLFQLIEKGLLQRSVDKTNFQYVQEIVIDKRKDFAALVLNYEYVWYGNLKITREQYEQLEKEYTAFNHKI